MREHRIPDSREMSRRAIEHYENQNGKIKPQFLQNNISKVLNDCILIERKLFDGFAQEIRRYWVKDFLDLSNGATRFPIISKIVKNALTVDAEEDLSGKQKLSKIIEILEEVNEGVSFSLKQSSKPRAGSALQNYLEHFFSILGFRYQRQQTIPSGEKLDLIFPNSSIVGTRPTDCILMECQTTLKDRFRLSLGKAQSIPGITKFIATVTGANIITSSDDRDLTPDKIREIKGKAWRLVALKQVADRLNNPTVMSFEEFVQRQYPSKASLW